MLNYEILGFSTIGTARLACNWLQSLKMVGQDECAQIVCADAAALEAIDQFVVQSDNAARVTKLREPLHLDRGFADWGTDEFRRVGLARLGLYRDISPAPDSPLAWVPFLLLDVDTVLLDDPSEYLSELDHLTFQSDRADYTWNLDRSRREHNGGVFWCPKNVRELWQVALKYLERADLPSDYEDQAAINDALNFLGWNPAPLDPYRWLNGRREWPAIDQSQGDYHHGYPFLFHANCLLGLAKEGRLRSANCWFVSDSVLDGLGLTHERCFPRTRGAA